MSVEGSNGTQWSMHSEWKTGIGWNPVNVWNALEGLEMCRLNEWIEGFFEVEMSFWAGNPLECRI